jgi:L-seryl-tRNA(Ser) seleniumtransferase
LGVRTIVNCWGTYTIISGSRMVPQAAEAMFEATNHYVNLDELMEKVGQRLAALTGAEWGYITSGCAAALAEVTAACIAGADPEKMARLPDASGMPNEVIMQACHRNSYDRALHLAGAQVVEVTTLAALRAALSERTAMLFIVGDLERPDEIPAATMIALGHARGIPTLVDAAAQRPDLPNRYLQLGADAVAYSGGKCLRGPQASGLLLGQKALLQAAFLNSAPHHGVARPMKAGKEEIMGLLAAVEAWLLGRDHAAEWAMWEGFLEHIRLAIADLPTLRTEVRQPGAANVTPLLHIAWDAAALGCTPAQVHQALWEGEPRIALHLTKEGLAINPYMMEAGDERIAAPRLRAALLAKYAAALPAPAAPPAPVGGEWLLTLCYVRGESHHALTLCQEGAALSGSYRGQYESVPVKGSVAGEQVTFSVALGYEANRVHYAFTGVLSGAMLHGEVTLGEYGHATWSAERVAP